jgi:glycosyltransferase involved in cell wall biosynthesis
MLLFPHITQPGGALNYTVRLAGELRRSGATVAILTLHADPEMVAPLEGLEVIALKGPVTSSMKYWLFFPFWQRKLEEKITAWCPDVLVPQVFPANWWGWIHKRKNPGTPVVWICQEPSAFIHSEAWIRALSPWWKCLLARLLRPALTRVDTSLARRSDAIIANSRFTAVEVERVYGRVPNAIASPGIDIPEQPNEVTRHPATLITVARLTRFKRVDFLLQIFRVLLGSYPDLRYIVVGTGEDEVRLKEYAAQLGIGHRVSFLGAVDDHLLASLLREACLFLHGAVGEPFGLAPLEAVAAGMPVVAHNSGGITEFIDPRCGALIDSLDPGEWAVHAARLINDFFSDADFRNGIQACALPYRWGKTLDPAIKTIFNAMERTE